MLTNESAHRRKLNRLVRRVVASASTTERAELRELLDGMSEFSYDCETRTKSFKQGINDLGLDDWGDAFVIALNDMTDPKRILLRKVKTILVGANDASDDNISQEELDTALAALETGLEIREDLLHG